jgi:NAD(P)-dependent dehydrogenase (short-subunit alcohol dehydrogenase family)
MADERPRKGEDLMTGGRTRTALVTGGTGGMGRVIAARLAADGFDAAEDHFGHLDVVVHTARINRPAALADLDLADFDETDYALVTVEHVPYDELHAVGHQHRSVR